MASAFSLKPWNQVVLPHKDILQENFDLSSYAANLGQVDVSSPECPEVYRDPVQFFGATYLTGALEALLKDVSAVLSGKSGNRLIQLRTPFGGGKTHTLIALLHLFRSRNALHNAGMFDGTGPLKGFDDTGETRVVVLPCLDLNAVSGRQVNEGLTIRTLWGEIAYRIGGEAAFNLVRSEDEARVSPGGDTIKRVLGDHPTLILLDEVLTYIESAMGVKVVDSSLGKISLVFLQQLTEVVRSLSKCALVYSLQRSVQEAVGDEALLNMLDQLVSRVDVKREPVSGDEVLYVVQKRLFQNIGSPEVRAEVGRQYSDNLEKFLLATAATEGERRVARDQADLLRQRIEKSYPFHPELLDLMNTRWGTIANYQRTRGALQFLATVVGAIWRKGDGTHALISPGDVPLEQEGVRNAFFTQVGAGKEWKGALEADLIGEKPRCKIVDGILAADAPTFQSFQSGTRLARALALYSFGGKGGEDKGVLRNDLLMSVQMPGLPGDVLDDVVQKLSSTLLYVHTTGKRLRFETKPNLNKIVDEELRKIDADAAQIEIKKRLEKTMSAKSGQFIIWPADSSKVPDRKPNFQFVFFSLEHAMKPVDDQMKLSRDWTDHCGSGKRNYKNALAFVFPDAGAVNSALVAARKVLAISGLLTGSLQTFEKEDTEDLKERKSKADGDLQNSIRQLYKTVFLPVAEKNNDVQDPIRIERFDIQNHHQMGANGLVESVIKVLENWVFSRIIPRKFVTVTQLGQGEVDQPGHWITGQVLESLFFGSVQAPKMTTRLALQGVIADAVKEGLVGYVMGARISENVLRIDRLSSLQIKQVLNAEDIDLSEGSFIVSAAQAQALIDRFKAEQQLKVVPQSVEQDSAIPALVDASSVLSQPLFNAQSAAITPVPEAPPKDPKIVVLEFKATSTQQFYESVSALQLLADMADVEFIADVRIYARGKNPINKNEYETGVIMALEEAGVDIKKK